MEGSRAYGNLFYDLVKQVNVKIKFHYILYA